ncbi:hypothetical protein OESDEN_18199 [Oesophagostomum dentatum]|uniref:YitH/HolE acetyltransferase (GNAT) domain-containing protein n=1 Tax=Oesophagostomum dentatum TaxID=61180 RepID=A0A0B1SB35_OESDE|nr:hypothetical protein OESDEN_18199 [Oesophagostomum dentatum]
MDMSSKYAAKYGFDKMPNYTHMSATIPTKHLIIPRPDPRYTLKDLKDVDDAQIAAYDASVSNRSRAKYLHNFISADNCHVKVALDYKGKIVGFCNVRAVMPNNLCTAPLFAENEIVARTLLAGVLSSIKNLKKYKIMESVYPENNLAAKRLFESIGGGHTNIEPIFKCAFTKKVLPVVEPKVFGILECANCFV